MTYPGANGRVAYTNTAGQIASVKADGSGTKPLTNLNGMSFGAAARA